MPDKNKIPLVSSEITGLWNSYMYDSMSVCVLKCFINRIDDNETRSLIQHALDLASKHIQMLVNIFNQEKLPIPDGFSDKDININAPRLFTDGFYLLYLSYMARIGLQDYSLVLNHIARSDMRDYFSKCIQESVDLYNMLTDVRLSKGIFIRAPRVEVPKEVQYIKSQNFMVEWFGEKRALVLREVTHIFSNFLSAILGRALVTGFGQVTKNREIAEYFFSIRDTIEKRIVIFSTLLTNENIPIPSTSDSYTTDSTAPPFSDKLMLFHIVALTSTVVSNYGMAIANNLRSDIQGTYTRLIAETMKFAKEGMDIMIKNGWMEQPPQAIMHETLSIL